jgi:hypothetical protein
MTPTPPGPEPDSVVRPLLVAVTGYREDAPIAHLAFPGRPTRWVEMKVRAHDRGLRQIRQLAELEVQALSRQAVQLLFEVAHPGPEPRELAHTVQQGFLRPGAPDPAERELVSRYAKLYALKPSAATRLLYEAGKMGAASWRLTSEV